jgi:hypothetical protein
MSATKIHQASLTAPGLKGIIIVPTRYKTSKEFIPRPVRSKEVSFYHVTKRSVISSRHPRYLNKIMRYIVKSGTGNFIAFLVKKTTTLFFAKILEVFLAYPNM